MKTQDDIELTLAGLSRILEHNVTEFSEYGPNHPGLITLPPEAGPKVNPLKIETWAVFLSTATAHGWVVTTGTNHAVTKGGIDAVSNGLEGVKLRIRRSKWLSYFLRGCASAKDLIAAATGLVELFKR